MNGPESAKIFDSHGEAYHKAFAVFLNHTDQKDKARAWLNQLVDTLPARRIFIDAGAGDGKVTAWFQDRFNQTIAIEPNASLRDALKRSCAQAEVLADGILDANPRGQADLVLCSHVFYYVDQALWMRHLDKLASWLSPTGVLIVALQNHQTDCMAMLDHFFQRRFDLSRLAAQFKQQRGGEYAVDIETVPAYITTPDFASAYIVAEFMLNLLPITQAVARPELEAWVEAHFADAAGGYRFSCHQDFLRIRPRR